MNGYCEECSVMYTDNNLEIICPDCLKSLCESCFDTHECLTQKEAADKCEKPCSPNSGCEECASYWERMISEGYWDKKRHRWTTKWWREVLK